MKRRESMRAATALILCGLGGVASCALIEGVTARIVVAGSVFATPALSYPGYLAVEPEVVASSWVGEREDELSTREPKPILDAQVALEFAGERVPLPGRGEGVYGTSSIEGALAYQPAATYEFVVATGGESYGGRTTAPPPLGPEGLQLAPAPTPRDGLPPGALSHPASTALTVTWSLESGRHAYVSVFRADPGTPDRPELVFDTRPKTAKEILALATGNPPTQVEIPAGTFGSDGVYAVVLVAANNGEKVGDVFGVSAFLVGSGAAQLLVVGEP